MNCPNCNSSNAYLGFMTIECINPNCHHYSEKQKALEYTPKSLFEESSSAKKNLFQILSDIQPMTPPECLSIPTGTALFYTPENGIKYVHIDPCVSMAVGSPEYTRLFCNNSYNNPPQNIDLSDEERIKMCAGVKDFFQNALKNKFVFDGTNETSVSIGFKIDENGDLKDMTVQKIY
jgi:hypothetical protein